MKVNWTAASLAQLRDISTFIARSSPHYAKKIVDRLTRRSQQIATFPRSGRGVPEANDVNIREVLEGCIASSITCSTTRLTLLLRYTARGRGPKIPSIV